MNFWGEALKHSGHSRCHIPEEILISETGRLKFMHIQKVSDMAKFASKLAILFCSPSLSIQSGAKVGMQ